MNKFERFKEDDIDFISVVGKYKNIIFSNLKFLILSGISILLLTILYLVTTPKQYNTFAKIKILEQEETSAFVLEDMMNFDSPFKNEEILENEIEILKSKNILERVIDKLSLHHQFSKKGFFNKISLSYTEIPFMASVSKSNEQQSFIIIANTDEQFTITNINNVVAKFTFGKRFILEKDTLTISKSKAFNSETIDNEYALSILDRFKVFLRLKTKIKLSAITDAVLEISLKGADPILSNNIIQTLLAAYNNDGINDDKIVSASTSLFLKDRVELIKTDMSLLEITLSNIKKGNNVFDINAINSIFSSQKLISNEMSFEIETQELLAKSFQKKVQNHNFSDLLPLPIEVGITNSELANFTNDFNVIIIERNKLLKGRTTENPEIQSLNSQLNNLLNNLNKSIDNYLDNLLLKKNKINDYDSNLESEFFKLNDTELSIIQITRDLEVKANILLFLLEKQEEASLKLAVNAPTFKILDSTYTDMTNASPNSKKTLILGFLLALLLPFLFIIIRLAFYNKITDKESLAEKLSENTPIIGEIPFSNEQIITKETRGFLLESFRLLRTNLNYLFANNTDCKTILVTSSILKEGKTFTAINLAQSLALANNKVVVLGLDLRNPQIHKYLQITKDTGLGATNYLTNNAQDISLLINQHPSIDFDFILSGPIPPNPAELLLSERINDIIDFARKNYDYVILDTAPCLLVADTLNIFKYADTTIYLTRSKYTKLNIVDYINQLKENNIFKNLAIVLNGLEESQSNGYGYNHGYGYGYKNED